jgi:hypothetical protein
MAIKKKSDNTTTGFTYFVITNIQNAGYTFTGYTDREGNHRYIAMGENERGNKIYRRFKFSPSQRTLSIPNTQQDVIKFLREHPECQGSPNGHYYPDGRGGQVQVQVCFKEMNEGKDAQLAIDAIEKKAEATSLALSLKHPDNAEELNQMNTLCGGSAQDPSLQLFHVLKYAESSPIEFLNLYEDPSRKVKFIVKRGVQAGVLTTKGLMIMWHDVQLGVNSDEACRKLLLDRELMDAVENELKAQS